MLSEKHIPIPERNNTPATKIYCKVMQKEDVKLVPVPNFMVTINIIAPVEKCQCQGSVSVQRVLTLIPDTSCNSDDIDVTLKLGADT